MKQIVLLFFLVLSAITGLSQNAKEDSLLRVLNGTTADTSRVILYNSLCKAVIQNDPAKALTYAEQGITLGRSISFTRGLCLVTNNAGICNSKMGKLDVALAWYRESLKWRKEYGDKVLIGDSYNNIGSLFYRQGKFREALDEYAEAEKIYLEAGDKKGVAGILNNKGSIEKEMGNYRNALDYYMKAADLYRELKDPDKEAMVTMNIGTVYHALNHYENALDAFRTAERIHRSTQNSNQVVASLTNQGEVLLEQGEFDRAQGLFNEALSLSEKTQFMYGIATAKLNLGQICIERGTCAADGFIADALRLYREGGFLQGVMMALHLQGRNHIARKEFASAIPLLLESLGIAQEQESRNHVRDNYEYLAAAYSGLGQHEKAYDYHRQFFAMHDSLYTRESAAQIAEMQVRYDQAENKRQIAQLEKDQAANDLVMAKRNRAAWYLAGGIIIIALIAIIILIVLIARWRYASALERKNREIQQVNASLESTVQERTADLVAVNSELDTFLYESTHALRRPLMRIQGLSELILTIREKEKTEEYLQLIDKTVKGMDSMLEKLIQVNENNHREVRHEAIDFKQLLGEVMQKMEDHWLEEMVVVPEGYTIRSDAYLMRVLLTNLMENAMQFPREEGSGHSMKVEIIPNDEADVIRVTDNGMGIAKDQIPHIFDMFYRGTQHSKGNGLGLYVVKKVVERLDGSVQVESREGEFTSITVRIPRTHQAA